MPTDWLGLVGLFLAGIALNLTPCVYPMLTITVSIFSRGENTAFKNSFPRACVYVLGIAVMYSSLGTVAALTGGFFGGLLQSAWVRLAIAFLMLALALSMFGLYRLEVPAALMSRLGGRRAGLAGLFVSGLLVGVFAAPCIGPPVVALLTHVAERQDPVYGFWLFFVMSVGLGFPYLILGSFSHLIKRMPKSGAWLVWVERAFGVVLLGFAIFYFLLAVAPPKSVSGDRLPDSERGQAQAGGLTWQPYTPKALASALASGRPTVLDFYADWCLPCQEMEAVTYRDARVIQAFDRFERIKVDLTDAGNEAGVELAESYRVYGIPTMVFFDTSGKELTQVRATGYIGPKEMLAILKRIPSAPSE